MPKFNKGDVVRLKSGGPNMVITTILYEEAETQQLRFNYTVQKSHFGDSPALYLCAWFDGVENKEHLYPEESLESII